MSKWRMSHKLPVIACEKKAGRTITDTILASESSLAKDWMIPEEDEAWADL